MNSLVDAGLILLLTFLATAKIVLQGKIAKQSIKTISDSVMYCACIFTVAALLFFLFRTGPFSFTALWMGACFGILTGTFQVAYALSMRTGPVSLAVLLANFSVIIPVVAAVLFYGEKMTLLKLLGLILISISIFLCVRQQEGGKINLPWLIAVIVVFLANGTAQLTQRAFRATPHGAEMSSFGVAGYLGAAMLMWVLTLVLRHKVKPEDRNFRLTGRIVALLFIIGAVLFSYQFLYTYALGVMDNLVFLPIYTLSALVLNYLSGYFLFKEHVTKRQLFGFGLGTVAIVLLTMA